MDYDMQSVKAHIYKTAKKTQQGFQYEINAAAALKPLDIVPKDFTPAGAGSELPDLLIQKNNKNSGCELKITAASAGSLVMSYENRKWRIGKENETDDEKIFVIKLANEVGVLEEIQHQWKNEPYKFTKDPRLNAEIEGLNKRDIYIKEHSRFKEIRGEIEASKIEEYYNKKKTHYVNVGTHGFYLLGAKNPLEFKNIPRFGSSASAKYRARVQAKGGGNYQFTFEMAFSILAENKSKYNIAPLKKGSVIIQDIDIDWYYK